MRRITLYLATALITFMVSTAFARALNSLYGASISVPKLVIPPLVPPDSGASAIEQELLEIERQYDIAQTRQDAAFFEKLETDNFILTYADGTTLTRAQDIALMKSWDPNLKFVSDELHVQLYGNAAILSGRTTEISPAGDRDSWRWLDLFVKRDGRWQVLSTTQVDW